MYRLIPGIILALACLSGCQGTKAAADPNAVLGPPPPRISLQQAGDDPGEHTEIQQTAGTGSGAVGLVTELDSTVVAKVSGQPVFAADVLRPMRPAIETHRMMLEKLPAEQQPIAMRQLDAQVRSLLTKSIPDYIDREVVLRDLNRTLKPEQVEGIRGEIDRTFYEKLDEVVAAAGLASRAELEELLGRPNDPQFEKAAMTWVKLMQTNPSPSLSEAHDAFSKLVMAAEYLRVKSESPKEITRNDLLEYYREHAEEYDMPLEVKWDQIVVSYGASGGVDGAAKIMRGILAELEQGKSFATLAKQYSNGATAKDGGGRDWIEKGSLADSELEEELFQLPVGGLSKVAKRDDRLEIVRCSDRRGGKRKSFEEMQDEIRQRLLNDRAQTSRRLTLEKMRDKTDVVVLFNASVAEKPAERFPMFK